MTVDFMEFLKDAFEEGGELDHHKIRQLAEETAYYLESLQNTLTKGDPKSKKEAIEAALEVKEFLETKTSRAIDETGMTPQQYQDFVKSSPTIFTNEETATIVDISKHLEKTNKKKRKKKLKPIFLS